MNTFGEKFTFTSFGESHGKAIGGVLDGIPAGIHIDLTLIQNELNRRAGRQKARSVTETVSDDARGISPRAVREADEVEWLSGVLDGITLGTPIAFIIRNSDARAEDYDWLKHTYRIGHADRVYQEKYGIRDHRGGGRASARETAARVVAGSIAKQLLTEKGINIRAELVQVGTETNPDNFNTYIADIQQQGDSIGGIIECRITGVPVGIGEPIFDKLQAQLAYAIMSINACKGFEYGSGFQGVALTGSEMYLTGNQELISGGIAGGISDGTPIVFRCVFKPTASNRKVFETFRSSKVEEIQSFKVGRHDACVAVRAVPVVEAMAAMVMADMFGIDFEE